MAKSAEVAQDVAATAALSAPYVAPQPTVVAQAEELPMEEPVAEAARVTQPPFSRAGRPGAWLSSPWVYCLRLGVIAYLLSRSRRV